MQLNRTDVLEAALELLDEEGLDRLTMRRLAARLDVRHPALYWHFPDKRALLNAMAEQLYAGVADVDETLDPFAQLDRLAHRVRAALLSRRDGARVVAGTQVVQPNTLALGDAQVRALRRAGAGPQDALLTMCTMQEFVLGHVLEEQGDEAPAVSAGRLAGPAPADPGLYPDLSEAIMHLTVPPRGQAAFEHGLSLILHALRERYAVRGDSPAG